MLHLFRVCLGAFAVPIASGCTWHVIPPVQVEQPAHIYASEYGRHTRMALPRATLEASKPREMIEYGFGDWDYYALEQRGPGSALRALFRSRASKRTKRMRRRAARGSALRASFRSRASALSRREVVYQPDPEMFRRANFANYAVRLTVEQTEIDALRTRLAHQWDELGRKHATVRRSDENVFLRRSDTPYHLLRNSNRQTASGCAS